MTAWLILIHFALAAVCTGYAVFLNQRRVQEWYQPDRTWVTVIGGDVLIWGALLALVALGALPVVTLAYWITLHLAAGTPIIIWQRLRAKKRADALHKLDQEV